MFRRDGQRIAGDLGLTQERLFCCVRDFMFYHVEGASVNMSRSGLALYAMLRGEGVIVAIDAVLQRTMPLLMEKAVMELENGGTYPLDDVVHHLVQAGYSRTEQVKGRVSCPAVILDVSHLRRRSRCEFFGDEIAP